MNIVSTDSLMNGHLRRKFVSVAFAASSVLLLIFCISTHETAAAFPDFYSIQIHDGKFEVQNNTVTAQNSSVSLSAKANARITLNFVSRDFVYTIFQAEHDLAKVVLPGRSAQMDVNLPAGVWEIRIAQGCGARSPGHSQRLLLESVDRP